MKSANEREGRIDEIPALINPAGCVSGLGNIQRTSRKTLQRWSAKASHSGSCTYFEDDNDATLQLISYSVFWVISPGVWAFSADVSEIIIIPSTFIGVEGTPTLYALRLCSWNGKFWKVGTKIQTPGVYRKNTIWLSTTVEVWIQLICFPRWHYLNLIIIIIIVIIICYHIHANYYQKNVKYSTYLKYLMMQLFSGYN